MDSITPFKGINQSLHKRKANKESSNQFTKTSVKIVLKHNISKHDCVCNIFKGNHKYFEWIDTVVIILAHNSHNFANTLDPLKTTRLGLSEV